MVRKQSSAKLSRLASQVLEGYEPTLREVRSLAASVLSQDEIAAKQEFKQVRARPVRKHK